MTDEITIITPTYNRPPHIVQRAISSVYAQTFDNFHHIVCTDGPWDSQIYDVLKSHDPRFVYYSTDTHLGLSGDGVRVQLLEMAKTPFVCFLDDDNILMPTYLEKMVGALKGDESAGMAICQCYHFGPLQEFHGPPPKVLTGIPPKLYHIDMMQCVLRTDVFKKFGGFRHLGYFSDGHTYEAFAKEHSYVEIPEILCIHLNAY